MGSAPVSYTHLDVYKRQLFPYCREYLSVLLLFTPASILQVLFQNLIVTAGRPEIGMALGAGAGMANLLLDYIFMARLQMGIGGAALGTGIGYLIPAVIGLWFFSRKDSPLRFRKPVKMCIRDRIRISAHHDILHLIPPKLYILI